MQTPVSSMASEALLPLGAFHLARAEEDGTQESFITAYDGNAGAIRVLFPRQRARQDLYFEEFRRRAAGVDEEEAPGTTPTGAPTTPL